MQNMPTAFCEEAGQPKVKPKVKEDVSLRQWTYKSWTKSSMDEVTP